MMNKKRFLKIIAVILLQTFLLLDFCWAAEGLSAVKNVNEMLAPSLGLDQAGLKRSFQEGLSLLSRRRALEGEPYFVDVPESFEKIFREIIFNDDFLTWGRIRNEVAPESTKFIPLSVNWINEGALKKVCRIAVRTDQGILSLGIRFYYESREFDALAANGKAAAEIRLLDMLHAIDESGIKIFFYTARDNFEGQNRLLFHQSGVVGFSVGEFIDSSALQHVANPDELKSMLRNNIATITNVWLRTVRREHRNKYRGFVIEDLKLPNFVYDQTRRKVRYIDVDLPERVTLGVLLSSLYSYLGKAFAEKGIPFQEDTLNDVFAGVNDGFKRYLEYAQREQIDESKVDLIANIATGYIANETKGDHKIKDQDSPRWMEKRVLVEAVTQAQTLLAAQKRARSKVEPITERSVSDAPALVLSSI